MNSTSNTKRKVLALSQLVLKLFVEEKQVFYHTFNSPANSGGEKRLYRPDAD